MRSRFIFIIFYLLLIAVAAQAEPENAIPKVVYYEAGNLLALFLIFHLLLRKKLVMYFNNRSQTVKKAIETSVNIKLEAEKKHQEYNLKIQELESKAIQTLNTVKLEAEQAKIKLNQEAQKAVQTLHEETERTIQMELARAKKTLIEEAMRKTLETAQTILGQSIEPKDQQRFQKEFLAKIEAIK